MPEARHLFIPCISHAPKICAVMVATADDIAIGGSIAKTMIFSTTPKDADAMTPIWLTMTVIIKNEILINASCNAMGADVPGNYA